MKHNSPPGKQSTEVSEGVGQSFERQKAQVCADCKRFNAYKSVKTGSGYAVVSNILVGFGSIVLFGNTGITMVCCVIAGGAATVRLIAEGLAKEKLNATQKSVPQELIFKQSNSAAPDADTKTQLQMNLNNLGMGQITFERISPPALCDECPSREKSILINMWPLRPMGKDNG